MFRKISSSRGRLAVMTGATSLLFLTGCVGDMPHRGAWVAGPQNQRIQKAYGIRVLPRSLPVAVSPKPLPAVAKKPLASQPTGLGRPRRP